MTVTDPSSLDADGLQARLALVTQALTQSAAAMVMTDAHGRIEFCNAEFTAITGYALEDVAGKSAALWNASEAPEGRQAAAQVLQSGTRWQGDIQARRKDGVLFWERQTISALHDDKGFVAGLLIVSGDISHLREIEQALLLRDQAVQSSSNGIMITRSAADDHTIVHVNPAFERITGYTKQEVLGLEGRLLVRDDLAQPGLGEIRDALRNGREGHAVLRNYRKDGTLFWNELHIAPVKNPDQTQATHFVSIINDVSERIHYQHMLEHQASHDTLTGLANRHLLNDRIDQAIARAKRSHQSVGVMLLDLDHFKHINDAYGHSAGDTLLKDVAQRLQRCVRETDTVSRLGGDEFVIVLGDLPQPDDVDVVADKVFAALAHPIPVCEQDVFVAASIGISIYPRDGEEGEILLRNADIAMYRVKEYGRNAVRQFTPEMGTTAIGRLDMAGALRRGLERNEFILHYQPKIELDTGRIVGCEALVRWQHPKIGLVHPIEFIHLAEETGLILQLGEWVLREACRQQVAWLKAGLPLLKMAINLSARQFREEGLAERISSIIHETGVNPQHLTLELTESMVMQDVGNAQTSLRALKNLGVAISLDDFGTGYSSLSYLRRFPIDELKIDRSFILDIHSNTDDTAIATAVVAMAHSLGLRVVAEGVEEIGQANMLKQLKCDEVQGYLYGRPLGAEQFAAWLPK